MAKPVFEIVDSRATPIGVLDLRRRELPARPGLIVTEITINDDMLMSSLSTVSERALATSALALHAAGDGLRVLVGGLGLGYTAHVALADPRVAYVRVVDRVPAVIGWLREGLFPLSAELNGDDRLEVCESDVYAELLGPGREAYDLVLIDVDHSPTEPLDPASEPFYTWQGQRQVVDHLAPAGVLAVWSSDDDDDFAEVLEEVYPEARRERVRWVNELIDDEEIEEILFLARRA
ncbi:MAG: polyamine aminopropyltransferase [Planctomycetota bacterium]